jgi:hypothetical protein
MSYGEQIQHVGEFFGDVGIGSAKGLANAIPETAALAYRMTGYAAAGVVSLVDTDISDRMFAQYEKVTGRVAEYDNGLQEASGTIAGLIGPTAVLRGAVAVGGMLRADKIVDALQVHEWLPVVASLEGLGVGGVSNGGKSIRFSSQADPLFDSLGHAKFSHPEEYQAIMADLQRSGVNVKNGGSGIAFSPNPGGGARGNEVLLPDEFSISALRHEYGHFLDHQALGNPRYIKYFENPRLIANTERRQYLGEVRFSREVGDVNARRTLTQNYLNERNSIVEKYYQRPYGTR